ncbi:hypothetical protein D3C86_1790660 [compost metagenome]
MEEIGGAVERIDDPGMLAVGAGNLAAFFHQEGIGGAGLAQFVKNDLLGAKVGLGDEIGRALAGDLQVLDLVEIAREGLAGLDRRADHDVEKGGTRHREVLASSCGSAGAGRSGCRPAKGPD